MPPYLVPPASISNISNIWHFLSKTLPSVLCPLCSDSDDVSGVNMSCSDSDDDSADEPDDQMIDADAQMDCGAWLVDGESDEGDEDHYVH